MHPILADRSRLGLYLLGWAPLALLVVVLLAMVGEASWGEAAAVGFPLVLLYAYLCLAAWYVCRLAPLRPARPGQTLRLLALHLGAAVLSSAVWVLLGWGWAGLLGGFRGLTGTPARFLAQAPGLFAVGVPIYLAAAGLHYLVLALEGTRTAEARTLEARVLAREAELKALQAQLDPHFLFNSLNVISAFAGSDPPAARKMAILLAEFLRGSLRLGEREIIPLAEEVAHAAAYLAVERVRFGDRLTFEDRVEPAAKACRVPALLLQPLVENAVRHGIAQLLEGGVVRIDGAVAAGRLRLAVENPSDPDRPAPAGLGVGLANVAARLQARYGSEAALHLGREPGRFRVEIEMPAEGPGERMGS